MIDLSTSVRNTVSDHSRYLVPIHNDVIHGSDVVHTSKYRPTMENTPDQMDIMQLYACHPFRKVALSTTHKEFETIHTITLQ